MMIGQHKRNLNVVPFRSSWKELFEQEKDLLNRALGEKALQTEHIGSTSIPGIVAKPIIDIMVAVVSLSQATEHIPKLEELGYEYKSPDTVPERLFFAKEQEPEYRTHHLNLVAQDSVFWNNQLAFRDYLRKHDQLAVEYGNLKKHLAKVYSLTKVLDRDGKTEFVTKILELARKERREIS